MFALHSSPSPTEIPILISRINYVGAGGGGGLKFTSKSIFVVSIYNNKRSNSRYTANGTTTKSSVSVCFCLYLS